MGAQVQVIPPEDSATGVEAEALDGVEGTLRDLLSLSQATTVSLYMTYDRHTAVPDVLVASKRWFDALAPDVQATLREVASTTTQHQRTLWEQFVLETLDALESQGVQIEAVERVPFRQAVQPVYTRLTDCLGLEFSAIIDAIRAVK
jgi:TRAP-type C4-dicarboxylate transport system substrate-binding protein